MNSYLKSKHIDKIILLFGDGNQHKVTILSNYDEPHRFYHNWNHIESMLDSALKKGILNESLLASILYHDIIYDPKRNDNEERSAELLRRDFPTWERSIRAVLDTKNHTPSNYISELLVMLDLEILNTDFKCFVEFENQIFKEYQFVDYGTYKTKRIEILEKLGVNELYIDYVRTRKPRIGIYAGSFNPFHKGHLNILKKAEMMFDKVIVARGKNPDKKGNDVLPLPESILYREIVEYNGLLTDLMEEYENDYGPLTLIRGLRNGNDLSYEVNQYRYMQDLKSNIQVCAIFCDREFEHISSSAIRSLDGFDIQQNYTVK